MKKRSKKMVLKRLIEAYMDLQVLQCNIEYIEIGQDEIFEYLKKMFKFHRLDAKDIDYILEVHYKYVHKFYKG